MKKKIVPVSVLIPTMNRPQALKRTIDTYYSAEYIPSQIVVVDQSRSEEDIASNKEIVAQLANINSIYYYQEQPSSTKARNKAFSLAEEEIIIYSDDDVDVYEDTVKKVYEIMQDQTISMIAGLDDNMPASVSKIGYIIGTKSYKNRYKGHVTNSMLGRFPENLETETETMWAMGFFFVVRKSLVENWNIEWDENLLGYAYAEDLDYSFRYYKKAKSENKKCIITREIHVKHLTTQEYRTPSRKSTFMYVLHRYYLSHKHGMGVKGNMAIFWCNFWMYIQRRIKKEGYKDLQDAMSYYFRNKKKVLDGQFEYE